MTGSGELWFRGMRLLNRPDLTPTIEGLPPVVGTWHPSAILRAPTDEERHGLMRALVEDLRAAVRRQVQCGYAGGKSSLKWDARLR